MAKPNEQTNDTELGARDWFLTAIAHDGPVGPCLDAVLSELDTRRSFIAMLKQNLTLETSAVDTVTDLGQKIRALENTLRFRLPMLSPERPVAWFRAPSSTTTGPFQATLLGEPVFAAYEPSNVAQVEQGLTAAWQSRQSPNLPFMETSGCLWRTLLSHNARLEEMCCLQAPFAGLRLDVLPDGIPAALNSRALASFLMNVRTEILVARDRLNNCYQQLRERRLKLWVEQRKMAAQEPKRSRSSQAAQDLRDEFRRRRSSAASAAPALSPADISAMQFMGFSELPPAGLLRQRYIDMAKKLHPDRQGGDDQDFKVLVNAYARLSARTT